MSRFDVDWFQNEYYMILNKVRDLGIRRGTPHRRDEPCYPIRDLGCTTLVLHDLHQPVLPLNTGRGISPAIAASLALQLISGSPRSGLPTPTLPLQASRCQLEDADEPSLLRYSLAGRIGNQVSRAIGRLYDDPDTEQAVISFWGSSTADWSYPMVEPPRVLSLGFRLVNNHLAMNVICRSQDALRDLPYDIFQFTQLHWTVAHALGVPPGAYIHTAWSLWLDERDLPRVDQIGPCHLEAPQPHGLPFDHWAKSRAVASQILDIKDAQFWYEEPRSHASARNNLSVFWYIDALGPLAGHDTKIEPKRDKQPQKDNNR